MALNDAAIRALKPTGKVFLLADADGLSIEVAAGGAKLRPLPVSRWGL